MDATWTALVILGILVLLRLLARIVAGGMQQGVDGLDGNQNRGRNRLEPQSRIASPIWAGVVLLFTFMLGAKLFPYFSGLLGGSEPPPAVVDNQPKDPADDLEDILTKLESNTAATIQRAQLADAKIDQNQCVALADRALVVVGDWEKEIGEWDGKVLALLNDPKGKYVAANADLMRQYRAIRSQVRPDRLEAESTRVDIQSVIEPVRLALADNLNAYKPEPAMLARLNDLLEKATASRDEYRKARLQVETLVSAAQSRGVQSAEVLQLAISDQINQENSEANALLERESEKARAEAADAVAKAKADSIRSAAEGKASILRAEADAKKVLDEQQVQRITEEVAAQRRKQDDELKASLARKEMEILVQQFERDWPAMKTYLTPFVTPGVTQPTSEDSWSRQTAKTPVSFGAIKAAGFLEPNFESLRKLMYKTSANGWNDRPMGGFPQYRGGDPQKSQELLQRIQDFLNKYGDVMVEKELLLP